eukprot:4215912-Pyramimonas_sp.AAC.1
MDVKDSTVDVKGYTLDVKGSTLDVKGSTVDVEGSAVDGSTVEVKGSIVDVKGSTVDFSSVSAVTPSYVGLSKVLIIGFGVEDTGSALGFEETTCAHRKLLMVDSQSFLSQSYRNLHMVDSWGAQYTVDASSTRLEVSAACHEWLALVVSRSALMTSDAL